MELWVALALGSAFLQNLRSAWQKALTARLGSLARPTPGSSSRRRWRSGLRSH